MLGRSPHQIAYPAQDQTADTVSRRHPGNGTGLPIGRHRPEAGFEPWNLVSDQIAIG
jgi:hypothetical protein